MLEAQDNSTYQKNKNSRIEEALKSFQQRNDILVVETDPVTAPPTVVMVKPAPKTSAGAAAVATKGAAKSTAAYKEMKEGIVRRLQDLWKDLKRKEFLPIKILNFLMYGGMMVLYPFLTLQARSLGITESELGIVYAFLPVVSLVGPPVAGMIADKIGNFKHFLVAMVFLSGLACLLYMAVPVGRIHHRMPDVLPLSLSCSGTNFVSHLKTLDKLECEYEDIIEPVDVLLSSCTSGCSLMRSAIENDLTLSAQFDENLAEEPITVSEFRHRLAKASHETNFNLTAIQETFQAEVRGVLGSRTLVLSKNVCPSLNERLRLWLDKNQNPRLEKSVASSRPITPSLVISSVSKSVISSTSESAILSTSKSAISSASKSAPSSLAPTPPSMEPLSSPTSSPEDCMAQCRVLVVREGLCKNAVSVEDVVPQLTFWTYVIVRLLNSVTLASSMPLFEGAVMTILKQYDGDFGFQKMYASLGPLVLTPLSGVLIDAFSTDSNTQDYRSAT